MIANRGRSSGGNSFASPRGVEREPLYVSGSFPRVDQKVKHSKWRQLYRSSLQQASAWLSSASPCLFALLGLVVALGLLGLFLLDTANLQRYIMAHWDRYTGKRLGTACGLPVSVLQRLALEKTQTNTEASTTSALRGSTQAFKERMPDPMLPLTSLWEPSVSLGSSELLQTALQRLSMMPPTATTLSETDNRTSKDGVSLEGSAVLEEQRTTKKRCLLYPLGPLLREWRHVSENATKTCPEFSWSMSLDLYDEAMSLWEIFCHLTEELDITWFAEAGIVIGGMRHHDIIPWDDDIDIRMSEDDWVRLYQLLQDENKDRSGFFSLIDAVQSRLAHGFRGKLWLKTSERRPPLRSWKYPFLDVWTIDTHSVETQFHEVPESQFPTSFVYPVHHRPVGKFWIPFAHRPVEVLRRKDFPTFPETRPLPVFDECVSSRYNHITETHRIYSISAACLSIADRFPLVTRRFRRRDCPYTKPAKSWVSHLKLFSFGTGSFREPSSSRLLQCLGRSQLLDTVIIVEDPERLVTLRHPPSQALVLPTDQLARVRAPWATRFDTRPPGSWVSPPRDVSTSKWPVLFVWECPEPTTSTGNATDEGMIEELSIGGIPVAVVELCHGDYQDVFYDTLRP